MTKHRGTAIFEAAGHKGTDTRHIIVHVHPFLEIDEGKPVEAHRVYIGSSHGDVRTSTPTDFIFACASKDWVFHEFTLGGTTWPGLAIFPSGGEYTVKFGDSNQESVVLHDNCNLFYTHRYQIVLRHRTTGELATCDPDAGSDDVEV